MELTKLIKRASIRRIELLKGLTESRQNLYEVQKRSLDPRKAVQFFRRVFFHLNRGGRSHIMIISSYACRLLVSFSSLFFHLLTPFFSLLKTVSFYTEKVLSISSHTILSQTVPTPLSEAEVSKWFTNCPLNSIRCHQLLAIPPTFFILRLSQPRNLHSNKSSMHHLLQTPSWSHLRSLDLTAIVEKYRSTILLMFLAAYLNKPFQSDLSQNNLL